VQWRCCALLPPVSDGTRSIALAAAALPRRGLRARKFDSAARARAGGGGQRSYLRILRAQVNQWAPHILAELVRRVRFARAAARAAVGRGGRQASRPPRARACEIAPKMCRASTFLSFGCAGRTFLSEGSSSLLSGSPNRSWIARGRSASGAGLSASKNLHSAMKAQMCLHAESWLAPRTID
jgi:hypothetical protein